MVYFFFFLVLCVVFVNGWTDAPSAVAGCISSGAMKKGRAILLAGVCNLLGALFAVAVGSGVAKTVFSTVEIGSGVLSLYLVSAAMLAVVIWAVAAFFFGIPTSESHALISGMIGAALGARGEGESAKINKEPLLMALIGLLLSCLLAYIFGKAVYSLILRLQKGKNKRKCEKLFVLFQRLGAAISAFMHGAQDSQKFVGVLMLGLLVGGERNRYFSPIFLSVLCAVVMSVGTLLGGTRIIKKLGEDMTRLDGAAGASSDAASGAVLLLCTLFALPVSTTHSKTCAMMGAGSKTRGGLDKKIARQMLYAWALTFPCCIALGYIFFILMWGG